MVDFSKRVKKPIKGDSSKTSLKDKILKRKKEIKDRSTKGKIIFLKADTTRRVRFLKVGEDNEFLKEIIFFYLGPDIKGVISPATFGEPCAIYEKYLELKESSDQDDKDLAKKFSPKAKYMGAVGEYKDIKGKEIASKDPKLVQVGQSMYDPITDYYLDEDEWGDMMDWENGYDLKLGRTGGGLTDTEYTVNPCKNTPTPKEWRKTFDLDELIRNEMPSYEETKEILKNFLSNIEDDDEDEKPKKKKSLKKKRSDL